MALINWRITSGTFAEWQYLMMQTQTLDPTGEEHAELVEQIRSLPNFPNDFDEWEDTIVPDVIDTRESFILPRR